jgi:hypothetical protein
LLERDEEYLHPNLEVVTMRIVPHGDERSVHRRGFQPPPRVVLALLLVG